MGIFTRVLIMLLQLERLFQLNILVLVDWVQSSSIGLGEHVGIKVADNLWAMYGHMSRIRAKMGDKVKAGQIVGDVGSSGWSTGPHVHYELRKRWTKWPTRKS